MIYNTHSILGFILLINLWACSANQTNTSDKVSNLSVVVNVSDDNSGEVEVIATAENAIVYHFYMNDGVSPDPAISDTGKYTHLYNSTGTYIIEVRAYGDDGRFIRQNRQLSVIAGDPVTVGEGYVSPLSYEGMSLVWNDEFEGNILNTDFWSYENGNGCPNLCGWGNNELEYYRPENSEISGGVLTIEARKENYEGFDYTSSKIISRDKQSFKYGRIDIRALLPKGQGIWPALWMLGANHSSVGWPSSGEIDIMEMKGGSGRENTITGNVFWDDGGVVDQPSTMTLDSGTFNDEYHIFSIVWDETKIEWFVNNVSFKSFDITHESRSEFHKPFYFIMNVAVGGTFPGNPDATTVFPTSMKVDYIRVFQKN